MIMIQSIQVTRPFRYLWLKHVTGVDLTVHCAKCLLGDYVPNVTSKTKNVHNLELPNGVYYLCGVSAPYKWENNFHLAFVYAEGETMTYFKNGISVSIVNARQLPISDMYIDMHDPNRLKKEYCTCRNWQFAQWLKRNPIPF